MKEDFLYINADFLETSTLHEKPIDLIIADLPQGITKNDWDVIIPLDKMWGRINELIKPNGAIILFGNQPFTAELILSNKKDFRYSLVWRKTTPTGHLNANKMPLRLHEDILVFYKKLPTYNPQKTTGHVRKVSTASHRRNSKKTTNYGKHGLHTYDSTERYPTSILKFPTDKQKLALHPTQKPVSLLEYLIKTYSNEGDTVLDFCMGSGSAGVACKNTSRYFIGIEKDWAIFSEAIDRIESPKVTVPNK